MNDLREIELYDKSLSKSVLHYKIQFIFKGSVCMEFCFADKYI